MTQKRRWLRQGAIAAGVLLALGSGLPVAIVIRAQTPVPPSGSAPAGQKLYLKVGCQQCHGYVGQGAAPTGPRIAPNPIALVAFSRYIRAPRANMPPYTAKVLSDQDVADIHAFLSAQSGPAKVDALLPPP